MLGARVSKIVYISTLAPGEMHQSTRSIKTFAKPTQLLLRFVKQSHKTEAYTQISSLYC